MSAAEWWSEARCRGKDPDWFLGSGQQQHQRGKDVCRGCPVRMDCLLSAMADEEEGSKGLGHHPGGGASRWFLRGGLTAPEREELARRHPTTNWRRRWEQRQAERRSA